MMNKEQHRLSWHDALKKCDCAMLLQTIKRSQQLQDNLLEEHLAKEVGLISHQLPIRMHL